MSGAQLAVDSGLRCTVQNLYKHAELDLVARRRVKHQALERLMTPSPCERCPRSEVLGACWIRIALNAGGSRTQRRHPRCRTSAENAKFDSSQSSAEWGGLRRSAAFSSDILPLIATHVVLARWGPPSRRDQARAQATPSASRRVEWSQCSRGMHRPSSSGSADKAKLQSGCSWH